MSNPKRDWTVGILATITSTIVIAYLMGIKADTSELKQVVVAHCEDQTRKELKMERRITKVEMKCWPNVYAEDKESK
jgi:hypothetical protein